MQFGLCVALLLLLVTGAATLTDPSHEAALHRAKREFSIYDMLRGKGASSVGPRAPKPTSGNGFNLADALSPAPQTAKPAEGNFEGNVIEKLNTIIENQNQQLRLLLQLKARSPSSRFG